MTELPDMFAGFQPAILGFVALLLASITIGIFLYELYRAKFIKWAKTQGVIVSSEIIKKRSHSNGKSSVSYTPMVHYKYHFENQKKEGTKLFSGSQYSVGSLRYAQKITSKYDTNKVVDVYYNLDNTTDTCLELGVNSLAWFVLLAGFILITMSYFILIGDFSEYIIYLDEFIQVVKDFLQAS